MARSELDIVIKVTDKASRQLDSVSGRFGKLGGIAAKFGVAAAAALTGVAAGALALAKASAPIPGITAAFDSLTEGIEGGSAKMLRALQEGSEGMVANTELMRQFNLANQLVGEDFAKNLPNAMGYLGKVSAATGEDMGFLMDSLIRGVGRLSPLILDNLGIQVDLNQAYEDYAATLGVSASELTKAQQQTALMNQVMGLLQSNTAGMPEVAGSAAAQFAQFGATLQNAKDQIGVALIPALTALVENLTPIIEEYGPQIAEWLGTNLPVAIAATADFVQTKLIPFLERAKLGFEGFKTAIKAIPIILQHIRDKFLKFVRDIKNLMPDWLIPGSPTPFELGIRGISKAVQEMQPTLAGAGITDNRQFFQGGTVTINNGTDQEAFESVLRSLT